MKKLQVRDNKLRVPLKVIQLNTASQAQFSPIQNNVVFSKCTPTLKGTNSTFIIKTVTSPSQTLHHASFTRGNEENRLQNKHQGQTQSKSLPNNLSFAKATLNESGSRIISIDPTHLSSSSTKTVSETVTSPSPVLHHASSTRGNEEIRSKKLQSQSNPAYVQAHGPHPPLVSRQPVPKRKTKLSLSKIVQKSILSDPAATISSDTLQPQISATQISSVEEIPLLSPYDLRKAFEATLPPEYEHHIISLDQAHPYRNADIDQSGMYVVTLRVNLRSKEEALQWLADYQMSSFTDWRVRRTFQENTPCLIFKKGFRCHNNTLAQYRKDTKQCRYKHTLCEASLMITVKNFEMKRSSDKLLKEAPCEITINNFHNHPLAIADSLRLRRPTKEVVETFRNLFSAGHSPSSAHRTFTYDIQVKHGEDFFKVLADGSQCPTKQWCYHLYYNMFKENYGSPTGELMLQSLEKAVKKYNSECGSVCAAFQKLGDETIIALCSPLMKRVHYFLKASGEIAFLDAGGGLDRQNNRVFPLLAPSVAGALPLGLVIVSSESEVTITAGLKLLMSLVPPEGFYGRGIKGPAIFMTDDCTAERNALMNIFPDAILLLCLFHILQAFWRYVTDSKHKVNTKDQMYVFELFKEWCYIECEEKFIEFHSDLQQNSQICQYSIVMKHIDDLFDRREEWALCYRSDLLTRGNNTNNYAESSILQLKDSILDRVRAYSLVQLFDFMTTRLELYFERRISVVLNNRKENYYSSKHFIRPEKIIDLVCFQTTFTNFYLVKNLTKKTEYVVDMNLELCGCPIGRNGQACKHQLAVVKQFQLSSSQIIPFHDEEAKLILHRIMSTVEPPSGWYGSLKAGPALVTLGNVVDSNESIDIQDEFGSSETTFTMQPSSAAGNTNFDQAVNDQLKKWSEVSEYVANGLKKHPEVFLSALQKFHMSFERAKSQSENAVLSAFHNFNRAQKHKPVRNRGNIGVNRSSVDRRKTKIGGRRCQQTGRPSKKAFTAEHGYTAQAKKSAWDRGAPQKRAALPHNLTQRVEMTAWKKRKTV